MGNAALLRRRGPPGSRSHNENDHKGSSMEFCGDFVGRTKFALGTSNRSVHVQKRYTLDTTILNTRACIRDTRPTDGYRMPMQVMMQSAGGRGATCFSLIHLCRRSTAPGQLAHGKHQEGPSAPPKAPPAPPKHDALTAGWLGP